MIFKMEKSNVIGDNIRRIRLKTGLTQAQFGATLNKSQSAIYSYENGTVVPSFDLLTEIAQLYGVPVGHIMGIEWRPLSGRALRELYRIYTEEVQEDE